MAFPEVLNVTNQVSGGWVDPTNASANNDTWASHLNNGGGNDVTGLFDLDPSSVVDADTITNITVSIEARCQGTLGKDDLVVDLVIGGANVGVSQSATLTSVFETYTFNDATAVTGWNVDRTAADINGMQVRVATNQTGMGQTVTYYIDHIFVTIQGTEGSSFQVAWAGNSNRIIQ